MLGQWTASTRENTSASHPLLYVGTTKTQRDWTSQGCVWEPVMCCTDFENVLSQQPCNVAPLQPWNHSEAYTRILLNLEHAMEHGHTQSTPGGQWCHGSWSYTVNARWTVMSWIMVIHSLRPVDSDAMDPGHTQPTPGGQWCHWAWSYTVNARWTVMPWSMVIHSQRPVDSDAMEHGHTQSTPGGQWCHGAWSYTVNARWTVMPWSYTVNARWTVMSWIMVIHSLRPMDSDVMVVTVQFLWSLGLSELWLAFCAEKTTVTFQYTVCSNLDQLESLALPLFHSLREKTSHFLWGCKNTVWKF